ncbi:mRNA interferase RelE/StbE [Methylobacter tundripaludum]|uniref:mRNA interferase RelE/StbE n=2 Tax=Methylobacter TaxID=429 RepID=A0A2S6HK48_9GAMM|nr:type II toxin-antitoxin system RelE/ParE family toxin [Methylobacter tundripaludum]PPK77753.1 mRNA interferase RelE/StbE [Methylobacter tundripaludum]
MRIEIKASFVKDLKTVPKDFRGKIANLIGTMEQSSNLSNLTGIKKLKGYQNFYRIQVGAYRLGFVLEENTIVLVRFLHRKEIYRFFP